MIITRRVWQLLAGAIILLLVLTAKRSFDRVFFGLRMMEAVFAFTFALTYFREQRRTFHSPDSILVINWNLFESILFLGSMIAYVVFACLRQYSYDTFYAYFNFGAAGMLLGVALGEWLWQNNRLRKLSDEHKARYWANYKDHIWG